MCPDIDPSARRAARQGPVTTRAPSSSALPRYQTTLPLSVRLDGEKAALSSPPPSSEKKCKVRSREVNCPRPSAHLWQRISWNQGPGSPSSLLSAACSPPWPTWFLGGWARASPPSYVPEFPQIEPPVQQLEGCSGWSGVSRGNEGEPCPHCGEWSPEPRVLQSCGAQFHLSSR